MPTIVLVFKILATVWPRKEFLKKYQEGMKKMPFERLKGAKKTGYLPNDQKFPRLFLLAVFNDVEINIAGQGLALVVGDRVPLQEAVAVGLFQLAHPLAVDGVNFDVGQAGQVVERDAVGVDGRLVGHGVGVGVGKLERGGPDLGPGRGMGAGE